MIVNFLITVCSVLFLTGGTLAQSEYEVKRGQHPYMAFVYYTDDSIFDINGNRFQQNAILVKPDWLISAAIDPIVTNDATIGFPQKTLLARAGAIVIDSKFTFNEDEDEQEREVVQLIRPANHSVQQPWLTDILVLKTLTPFNMTTAVGLAPIHPKHAYSEKFCSILIFGKRLINASDDKLLMQLSVEMLPSTMETCGADFVDGTMTCALDADENKNIVDLDYCSGNSGGPLICEGEVMGVQTYIENKCKSPHLFQFLPGWNEFITCGIEDRCDEESCNKVCKTTNKDDVGKISRETTVAEITSMKTEITITPTQTMKVTDEEISSENLVQNTKEETTATETVKTTASRVTVQTTTLKIAENKTVTYNDVNNNVMSDSDAEDRKPNVEAQVQKVAAVKRKQSADAGRLCGTTGSVIFVIVNLFTVL